MIKINHLSNPNSNSNSPCNNKTNYLESSDKSSKNLKNFLNNRFDATVRDSFGDFVHKNNTTNSESPTKIFNNKKMSISFYAKEMGSVVNNNSINNESPLLRKSLYHNLGVSQNQKDSNKQKLSLFNNKPLEENKKNY